MGAGLAGLTAARRLTERGRRVVVLEAKDRVGGRVYSVPVGGAMADLGAQWVGPGQVRMYALAQELALTTAPTFKSGTHQIVAAGHTWSTRRELPPLPAHVLVDVLQVGVRLVAAARKHSPSAPWEHATAAAADKCSAAEWLQNKAFTEMGGNLWRLFLELQTCADAGSSSALDLFQQLRSIGGFGRLGSAEQDWFVGGAQAIPLALARMLGPVIHLSTPVHSIEQDEAGVVVHGEHGEWRARYVVVAVPLSVAGQIHFRPGLSSERALLHRRAVRGHVVKAVLAFDRPFWREAGASGQAVHQDGPVNVLSDAGTRADGSAALTGLTSGRHALRLGALGAEERKSIVIEHALRAYPGAKRGNVIGYADHDWSADTYIGGGYAARLGIGSWTEGGRGLRAPVGRIHWAGTETAAVWRSYMEGAVASGEYAAEQILQTA